MNTKKVGNISQAAVIYKLESLGYSVSIPFGDNERYDCLLDMKSDGIKRVQVKTGRIKKGSVVFEACSTANHCNTGRRTYRGQADLFAVFVPENNKFYMIPVDAVGKVSVSLRLESTKNNQAKGIRWARDYELG